MRVILANPRGFCAGVNMAIDCLEQSLHLFGSPLYVYHEIVHNRSVVERFKAKGVTFVNETKRSADWWHVALFSAWRVACATCWSA
jgi:4-hydroxy-3-methylbut-2-enyl diphosphate reductase IspH